jgi:hypothetical protein
MTCTASPWENDDFTADLPCPAQAGLVWGDSKMPQNRLLVPAVLASAVLALVSLQLIRR